MASQTETKIVNELLLLVKVLQPAISSDGRNLSIKPASGKAINVKLLRSSVIQTQTPRFR